ncbi:MAG: hypothetical protein IJQ82_11790 [Selenomonadaceae bacterium]|nr:hypothetical protein [Selenomonadaceae bacterium]
MDKQKFIQKVTACRVIADDLLADTYNLEDKNIRWESIWRAERMLDEIDALLNYLQSTENEQ